MSIDHTRNHEFAGRDRSTSTSTSTSGHRRSLSGSLFSRLSFLRLNQTQVAPDHHHHHHHHHHTPDDDANDADDDLLTAPLSTGSAMSSALQQQRRTRRRRGSLRKTALLGGRFDRDKKPRTPSGRVSSLVAQENESTPRGSYDGGGDYADGDWPVMDDAQKEKGMRKENQAPSASLGGNILPGDVTTDEEEEEVSFPRLNGNKTGKNTLGANADANDTPTNEPPIHTSSTSSTGLHIPTPPSSADSYYALHPESAYRSVHRPKSPLATHADIKPPQDITWDYAETEWWGWIILIVTWLVFVVGMGSCFEVWSWAWDVGETPYAPPELEDDPTLPIVGYYPALIILTAVMSWVWVVVAWVGMKYFKHANISGEDL